MRDIIYLKKQIEEARAEVRESLENDPYEVTYEKNLKLDKLIEEYIDMVEQSTTLFHQSPPSVSKTE